MSRQIPIFVDPEYKPTFNESRKSSEPMPMRSDTRRHRFEPNTDRIEKEFENASKRFFDKNLRGRQPEFTDNSSWERDLHSHSPPMFQERPFGRRGSNPSNFSRSSPSWRRNRFDDMIRRMMNEDTDDFEFPDPEFGNFHVRKKKEKHYSPENAWETHKKVVKTPSTQASAHEKAETQKGNIDNYTTDDQGFVDIPVVVCKGDKDEEKTGEKEKLENEEDKNASVTREQYNEKEQNQNEKNGEKDPELTVKISVDSTEEKCEKDNEEITKADENIEENDLGSQENENEKSAECEEENEMPEESQQSVQLSKIKAIEIELEKVLEKVKAFKPTGPTEKDKEYLWLEEMLMRTLMGLDTIEANGSKKIRDARRAVVKRVQMALNELEKKSIQTTTEKP